MWIIHHGGNATLARIDPTSNEVTVIPLGVGSHLVNIAPAFGSLWVTDGDEDAVYRIDRNGQVIATVALEAGAAPNPLAVGPDSIWVGTLTGIVRIDPASNEVRATVPMPDSGVPWALALGHDSSAPPDSCG
jgi:streptogramin lyase